MASDLAKVQAIAKRVYSTDAIGEQTRRDHAFQEMLTRKKVFGGEDFRYIVRHANPQSVSGSFANAQTQADGASSLVKQFATQPGLKYCIVKIDGPSLSRLRGNYQSFVNHVTMELDGGLEELGDSIAFDTLGPGSGQRGRRLSAATNVITLTAGADVRNFKPGMTVIASANADGSSPRTGSTTVTAVSPGAGTITLLSAAAITSFANNDFLFRQGDPGTTSDSLRQIIPLTEPVLGVDSFRGVDRGSDPQRLAGVRLNDTSQTIEETTGLLAVNIKNEGKKANCAFWNPIRFHEFTRRMNAKVEFQSAGGTADYGFEYVMIHTSAGVLKVYSEPDLGPDVAFVGKQSSIEVRHLDDGLPDWINDDGLGKTVRMGTADAVEARMRGQHQLIVTVPGEWGIGAVG
jgi:hypothetical protein